MNCFRQKNAGSCLVVQQIKDPALLLHCLGLLLWHMFNPWPQELPNATGIAKKKKERKGKERKGKEKEKERKMESFFLGGGGAAWGSSWVRDWNLMPQTTAHHWSLSHCTRPEIKPTPPQWPETLQLDSQPTAPAWEPWEMQSLLQWYYWSLYKTWSLFLASKRHVTIHPSLSVLININTNNVAAQRFKKAICSHGIKWLD